ncbi:hypothetical protein BGW80DRAFT_191300 [Lactifluus volemus]|nr:hypothetical protein BGW80DRAFT_191300 [Lactifluus volemus]
MFNDLFADDLLASTLKPAPAQVSQDDNYDPAAAGREFSSNDLRPRSSEGVVPVNALQTSSLVKGEGEMVDFDVTAASLSRWQHRDNTMLKNAPGEGSIETGLDEVTSTSAPDSPNTDRAHRFPEKVLRRRQPVDITPQTSRYLPLLPEINQSPIISGTHLMEAASVKSKNLKNELTRLLELSSSPTILNRTDSTQHHDTTCRLHTHYRPL